MKKPIKCPYHPEEKEVWIDKNHILHCAECEYNPPDIPDLAEVGRTNPEIRTHLDKLD